MKEIPYILKLFSAAVKELNGDFYGDDDSKVAEYTTTIMVINLWKDKEYGPRGIDRSPTVGYGALRYLEKRSVLFI